jgi:hypothetical protein
MGAKIEVAYNKEMKKRLRINYDVSDFSLRSLSARGCFKNNPARR